MLLLQKSILDDLKSSIKITLENAEGEGKIKILSAMAMVIFLCNS